MNNNITKFDVDVIIYPFTKLDAGFADLCTYVLLTWFSSNSMDK